MKPAHKKYFLLSSIILLGLALRLAAVFKYGNFWDDEMFNFVYSQKTWPQGLVYWLWETNPPLHLLILKLWFFVFPANELFARFPSVLAGTASIYFIYKLGKDLFNEKTGYLAAFYLAIHPYNIFWSATARIYVFLMLLAILSTSILYKQFFWGDISRKTKISGAIINGLLIFSHLSSLFFLAGQLLVLALFKGKSAVTSWIKLNLAPFVLGGSWILASLYIKRNNSLDKAWFLNLSHTFSQAISPLLNLLVGQFWVFSGLTLIFFTGLLVFYKLHQTKSANLLFLITLIIVPIALSLGLRVWNIKFIIAVLPLLVIAICYSLSDYVKDWLATLLIASACLIGLYILWNTLPITDWKQNEALFKQYETSDKFVLVYNSMTLKSQIDRYLNPTVAKNSKTLVFYKGLSWDEMLVEKNYIAPIQLSAAEKNSWYENNKLDNYSVVALLQNEIPNTTKLSDLFAEHGWKLKQPPVELRISGTYQLYIYIKIYN